MLRCRGFDPKGTRRRRWPSIRSSAVWKMRLEPSRTATVLISGFGAAGVPTELIHGLLDHGAKELTVVSNNAGIDGGAWGSAGGGARPSDRLLLPAHQRLGRVRRALRRGQIELELVPKARCPSRCGPREPGSAGSIPRSGWAPLADGKTREIDGKAFVFEKPLAGDLALVGAKAADRWGNLIYNKSARNFGPVMAMAAKTTVVQVGEIAELGALDPEVIVTPGIFVDRVIKL